MAYAVIVGDAEAQAIEGNAYAPTASGTYRFAVLDTDGTVKARSAEYAVLYQDPTVTEPETEQPSEPAETIVADTEEAVLTQEDILVSVSLAATQADGNAGSSGAYRTRV